MAQTSLTRFPGDVRVLLTWISAPDLAHYEETVRFVGPDRRVTLTFPSPYLRHAPTALAIERMDGGSLVEERHLVSYEEAFRAELHHFRETVLAGRPADPGPDEAVGDARWIEAIARAMAAASREGGPGTPRGGGRSAVRASSGEARVRRPDGRPLDRDPGGAAS
jgi:hypothetical protein